VDVHWSSDPDNTDILLKATVTGATGFLGNQLCRTLVECGYTVRVTIHKHRGEGLFDGVDVEFCNASLYDEESLFRACSGVDVVFHCAALVDITRKRKKELWECNVLGPRNMVRAVLRAGCSRLVHVSSIHAIEHNSQTEWVDETLPLDSNSSIPYNRSKALGQQEVLQAIQKGLDAVIVHPTGIIGPRDLRPTPTGRMLQAMYEGYLPALVAAGFDWVDVRDVCSGIVSAAEKGRRGSAYLLSGHWVTFGQMAQAMANITGRKLSRLSLPVWIAYASLPFNWLFSRAIRTEPLYTAVALRILMDSNRNISCDRAKEELDYHARPFLDTMQAVCEDLEARKTSDES